MRVLKTMKALNAMKTIGQAVMGVWCVLTAFVSPVWLVLAGLFITGKIYQYDAFMDEGTAEILGVVIFVVWVAAAFLPDMLFLKRVWKKNRYCFWSLLGVMMVSAVAAAGMCGWDLVAFLTSPGGITFGGFF